VKLGHGAMTRAASDGSAARDVAARLATAPVLSSARLGIQQQRHGRGDDHPIAGSGTTLPVVAA
jgi:hypothetical protein